MKMAKAVAASGSGNSVASNALESSTQVAPLMAMGPPGGGNSSGRIMQPKIPRMKR